ncbi:hypothetical protein FRC01_007927 [Tulasnella sp. 417]|nr:hypothetical protein FRC01_007927 [Tulasnella sp. 417]
MERLQSLTRELEMLDLVNHPHVVKLTGFVEDAAECAAWLVFPWEANGNVREFLASGTWEIPERISLLAGIRFVIQHVA